MATDVSLVVALLTDGDEVGLCRSPSPTERNYVVDVLPRLAALIPPDEHLAFPTIALEDRFTNRPPIGGAIRVSIANYFGSAISVTFREHRIKL